MTLRPANVTAASRIAADDIHPTRLQRQQNPLQRGVTRPSVESAQNPLQRGAWSQRRTRQSVSAAEPATAWCRAATAWSQRQQTPLQRGSASDPATARYSVESRPTDPLQRGVARLQRGVSANRPATAWCRAATAWSQHQQNPLQRGVAPLQRGVSANRTRYSVVSRRYSVESAPRPRYSVVNAATAWLQSDPATAWCRAATAWSQRQQTPLQRGVAPLQRGVRTNRTPPAW